MSKTNEIIKLSDDDEESSHLVKELGDDEDDPTPKQIFNAIAKMSKAQKETSDFLKTNKVNIEKIPLIVAVQNKHELRITRLEKQLDFMQQKDKENNLIIHGVPRVAPENVAVVFRKLTKLLLGVDKLDVQFISAMKVKAGGSDVPIVVRLTHVRDKILLLKKKKEKGDIFLEQLGFDVSKMENRKVFFSTQLIQPVYNLLKEAKKMKQLGFEFIWSRNTSVFIQQNAAAKKIKFDSIDELEQFKLTLNDNK